MPSPQEFQLIGQDRQTFDAIRACLSPDLLTPEELAKIRPSSHPVTGHCFIATLATYHLIGKRHGLLPHFCKLEGGGTHWWLWNSETSKYLDPTFEQAAEPFPYDAGQKNLRYVKKHKRTNELVGKVTAYLNNQSSANPELNCQSAAANGLDFRNNFSLTRSKRMSLADIIRKYQDKLTKIGIRRIFWIAVIAWCGLGFLGGIFKGYGDVIEHDIRFNVEAYSGRISTAYDHAQGMQMFGFAIMLLATICYIAAFVSSLKSNKFKTDCILLLIIPTLIAFTHKQHTGDFNEKANFIDSIALAFSMPIVLAIILATIIGAKLPNGGKLLTSKTENPNMTAKPKNSEKIVKTKWADNGCPANTEITILGRDSKAETSMGAHKIQVKDKKGNKFTIDWANTKN